MTNLYFSIAGFFCAILIMFMFFSKEKVNSVETKLYGVMIISSFMDIILSIVILFIAYINYNSITYNLICILNKIDFIHYILWPSLMFIYVFYITYNEKKEFKKSFNSICKGIVIAAFLAILIEIFLPITLYNIDGYMAVYGVGVNFVYFIDLIYLVLIVLMLVMNIKKIFRRKYTPIFALIFFMIVAAVVRVMNPTLIIIPAIIVYIDLIMYFTIENPDLKMVKELEYAKSNAERANNAKTEFLSSMSHEIRTPLNAIVGFSNSILEEDNVDEIKAEAKDIIMASNNLLEIVNGILDISKIEAGKMEIVNVNYKPRVIFNDLVKLIKPRIGEKPIELKTSFSDDIPYELYGDMGKVKEIITNLLTNAAKYTDKGIIDFSVSCINEKNYSKLVISVEDTGRGIKPEKIDKLFTKFNRLEEDRNTTLEGTGLGLAITKSLVEMMGGKIIVQSKYGSGSKFTVYLKQGIVSMNNNGKEKEEVIVEDKELDYSNKKVLIVDDNNLNIKVASRMLKNYNITPDCVSSGMECLEKVGANKYDLILLDDMMPKMSGVETLAKLKNDDSFDTPVVVLTANAISGMREKYIKDGFCDYLAKPIDKLELRRVLNEYLSKK